MKVLFRVDATIEAGSGHFMRCLNLADALKTIGAEICYISRNLPEYLQGLLAIRGHNFLPLNRPENIDLIDDLKHSNFLGTSQELDALDTIQLAGGNWDWIVIDHYGIDARWESRLRKYTQKLFVIDDIADRVHDCDLLLDQNLFVSMDTRYKTKVPDDCVLLLGPHFVLLSDEFVKLRRQARQRSGSIKRVLVFFGSVDADNYTEIAIQALVNVGKPYLHVDVVIGEQHPCLQQIRSLCIKYNFLCHIQTQQMAELILQADFAIGSGGISTYERLFLRLPAILKAVSFNQIEPLKYMCNLGLISLFSTPADLEARMRHILDSANSSPPECVEDGSKKIAAMLTLEFANLRLPKPFDVRRTFKWLQDIQLREDFIVSGSPTRTQHFFYWSKLLTDPDQRAFSIYSFEKHVGNCGLRDINKKYRSAEIWIYLADLASRGRGVADGAVKMVLKMAINDLSLIKIYLHVAKTNAAAIRLYERNGFQERQQPLKGRWVGRDSVFMYMEHIL